MMLRSRFQCAHANSCQIEVMLMSQSCQVLSAMSCSCALVIANPTGVNLLSHECPMPSTVHCLVEMKALGPKCLMLSGLDH